VEFPTVMIQLELEFQFLVALNNLINRSQKDSPIVSTVNTKDFDLSKFSKSAAVAGKNVWLRVLYKRLSGPLLGLIIPTKGRLGVASPTHTRAEGGASVWGSEFTTKAATLQGDSEEFVLEAKQKIAWSAAWCLLRGILSILYSP
jgi:hypothetical protein